MSGTLPTTPEFVATNFKIVNPAQTSTTFGGKMRRVSLGSTYYTFTVKYPPMTRAQAQPIIAFLSSQYGQLDSFQVYLPIESYPRAAYAGSTMTVTGGTDTFVIDGVTYTGYAAGRRQVNVTGGTPFAAMLRAGDFFKFNWTAPSGNVTHSKVYMAITDEMVEVGGTNTLNFSGSLMLGVPNGTALTLNTVPFTVILNSDVQEYGIGSGEIYNLEFDVRELI